MDKGVDCSPDIGEHNLRRRSEVQGSTSPEGALPVGVRSKVIATMLMGVLASQSVAAAAKADPDASAVPICSYHMAMTGEAGGTIRVPANSAGTSTYCNLRRGNFTRAVAILQQTLREVYDQPIAVDQDFGPATEQALKNVQRLHGITADGVYGPQTRDHLCWLTTTGDACSWYPTGDFGPG